MNIQDQLNQFLEDCAWTLSGFGFRFAMDGDVVALFEKDLPSGLFIEEIEKDAADETNLIARSKPQARYLVQATVMIRGCYRTRNGDGWPDEYDSVEIKECASIHEAFVALLEAWFRNSLNLELEGAAEQRAYAESEEIVE